MADRKSGASRSSGCLTSAGAPMPSTPCPLTASMCCLHAADDVHRRPPPLFREAPAPPPPTPCPGTPQSLPGPTPRQYLPAAAASSRGSLLGTERLPIRLVPAVTTVVGHPHLDMSHLPAKKTQYCLLFIKLILRCSATAVLRHPEKQVKTMSVNFGGIWLWYPALLGLGPNTSATHSF